MTKQDQQQKILDFVQSQMLGVIATCSKEGNPQAALIAITETEDFEFIFGTSINTRKYNNLQNNPHVAFAIGHDITQRITVQLEGVATELTGQEVDRYRDIHIQKNPYSAKFAHQPQQRWFKVNPTWVRYTDLSAKPQEEFELTFE